MKCAFLKIQLHSLRMCTKNYNENNHHLKIFCHFVNLSGNLCNEVGLFKSFYRIDGFLHKITRGIQKSMSANLKISANVLF